MYLLLLHVSRRPLLVTCISLSSVVWPYKLEATKREQEVVSHGLSCLQFVFVWFRVISDGLGGHIFISIRFRSNVCLRQRQEICSGVVGVASFLLVNFGRPIRLMFYVNDGLLLITAVFFFLSTLWLIMLALFCSKPFRTLCVLFSSLKREAVLISSTS